MNIEQNIQEQIMVLTNIIVNTVPVEQIYLFGSYIYGTPHEDSDVDMYVVMKDDAPYRAVEAMDMIGLSIYRYKSIPTDIFVSKKSNFENRLSAPTLEQEVAEKGIRIYG